MKTPHIPLPSASRIAAAAALALFLLPALPLHGQQSLADDPGVADALHLLDTWMDAAQAYGGIPGASLSVVHDLGEEFLFEEMPDGRMLMWRNDNYSIRAAER